MKRIAMLAVGITGLTALTAFAQMGGSGGMGGQHPEGMMGSQQPHQMMSQDMMRDMSGMMEQMNGLIKTFSSHAPCGGHGSRTDE